MRLKRMWSFAVVGLLAIAGCTRQPPTQPLASDTPQTSNKAPANALPQKVDAKHLPNAFRLHEKVISGGLPEGELAFQELEALGIKTVISVDGAKPDVEIARRHHMRYVHLPHGYDGVPETRGQELAKAVRDLPGPVYIHCHHGKHRSPAAATIACVSAGLLPHATALGVLKAAGTSNNYRGLYDSAESARKLDNAVLDALQVEFKESAPLPKMAEAMVAIEHTHDHLQLLAKGKWKPLADHPALDSAHEALLLKEHFVELARTDEVKKLSRRFRELLSAGEAAAEELETALLPATLDLPKAAEAFERISNNCTTCHREIRDIPLREKRK